MSDNSKALTTAAAAVMQALEPLTSEECERVLESAAALHGIAFRSSSGKKHALNKEGENASEEGGEDEQESKSGKQQSLVEFLNQKRPATNAQRITCFAFYREHVEKKGTTFAKADLEPYFAAAKLAKPGKNYHRDWNNAVKEGWIHDDGANSYLTQGGEAAVNAGFGGKAKPRGGAVKKATKAE